MSDLWLVPLGVGAAAALALVAWVRRLDRTVSDLQRQMRPLRVRNRPDRG